jgi:tRNA (mo5U34)-methyltransferase
MVQDKSLRARANDFHEKLAALKNANPFEDRRWYPWPSLGSMDTLDEFLGGDVAKLQRLIGDLPVLDVGCGDGDAAFFLESLGPEFGSDRPIRVDCIDYAPTNYNWLAGARKLKQLLGSNAGIHEVDLDRRPDLPAPRYGLTLMLGVLYHLKNPFLALETLARASRHIFLGTRIASRTPEGDLDFSALPLAYLVDEDELNHDATNYWIFSEAGLKRLMRRAGWEVRQYATVGATASSADPVTAEGDARAYLLADSRFAAVPDGFHLEQGWHELEFDSWRWTARCFSVSLRLDAPLARPVLRFRFHVPKEAYERRRRLTLAACVNGTRLRQSVFDTPGEHEYRAEVPSLQPGAIQIDFELDRAMSGAGGDERELGVLVNFSGPPPISVALG